MNKKASMIARLAGKVQAGLQRHARARSGSLDNSLLRLCREMESLQELRRKLTLCHSRSWEEAARSITRSIDYELYDVAVELRKAQQLAGGMALPQITLRQVHDELLQLEEEFGGLSYDREEGCLTVTTEPIVLEEIELGRFEIRVQLSRLAEREIDAMLHVVALDPNPATCNIAVTHPHVSNERLCMGDATMPMQQALASGRICDFFLLIRGVLTTYNSGSPFVPLDHWEGKPCHDCGYMVDGDHASWCEGCKHEFCDDCMSFCRACDTSLCRGCVSSCGACDDRCCDECLNACLVCEDRCCPECLKDGECLACREDKENANENEQPGQPDVAPAAVQAT